MTQGWTRLPVAVSLVVACCSLRGMAEDWTFNLGPEEFVQVDGHDLIVPGYSVPCWVDWNNDHLNDLVVGEGGGTVPGRIRVYLNVGTALEPRFSKYFYIQSNGQDLTCPALGCMGCYPRVVDWDGDGRKDLIVGLADGTVKVYLNTAEDRDPWFDAGQFITATDQQAVLLDVGARAAPCVFDWNYDGMMDLVVGGMDGLIHVYYNCGCGGPVPPHFYGSPQAGAPAEDNGRDLLVPGLRSSPVVMDLDGDGLPDLLTGNTEGQILFYRNVGFRSLPLFSGYSLVQSNGQPIHLGGSLRSRPFVCHWVGDSRAAAKAGSWDLLVGYGDGKVRLYRGSPAAARRGDLDGDGLLSVHDAILLCEAMDQPGPELAGRADLNGDGVIDDLDLEVFVELWLVEHEVQDKVSLEDQ
jgi:hypothetical protein